nr:alpha/beta hydrolase [Paracoccus amoyensis]
MIFIPGFMLDDDLWRDLAPLLHGLGPFDFADYSNATSFEDAAARIIAAAPDRFALIGFSMGGYVAREIALQAGDRVSHLVLIATSARGDTPERAAQKQMAYRLAKDSFRGVSRRSIAASLAPERQSDTALIERIHDMSLRLGRTAFRNQLSFPRTGDIARLPDIHCPTLVIAGTKDQVRSIAESQELVAGIPNAEFATLDAGHMLPIEAAEPLAALLRDFLSR